MNGRIPRNFIDELLLRIDLVELISARVPLRKRPAKTLAIDYLKHRGLSGEIAKQFGIGFSPPGWDNLLKQLGKTSQLQKQLLEAGLIIKKDEGGYYDRFRARVMFPIRNRR